MTQRTLYLAAYDITTPSRLAAALKLVRAYATGGQKSVHEIFLTTGEKSALLRDMAALLQELDRFLLLRLDARSEFLNRGNGHRPADPDYFYLG